ncbi:hypothetical protein L1049_008450 [Liquidambar formosana]|uniref:Histone-lysine N-methyltransferase SUVR3 n=1 Tax=Liquidambar formosana TaxID=63359 RepID=A0AAP0S3J3_LIQFO
MDNKKPHGERALFECAELILPWLDPPELASISSTCKTLYHISKTITARRTSDASRAFENFPIPFINAVDHQPYFYFIYTPSQILPSPSSSTSPQFQRQSWGSSNSMVKPKLNSSCVNTGRPSLESVSLGSEYGEEGYGCDCETCGEAGDGGFDCPCSRLNWGEIMSECGPSCRCGLECPNRLTQREVSVQLKIVRDQRKGWGVHAAQLIRQGQFVCEYAGELLTTKEARRRQHMYDELSSGGRFSSALLVVREHLPSGKACLRINIDATRVGNVARFINHSCDGGNLLTMLMRSSGALLPRLCFFASRDIQEDEELSFSYGDTRLTLNGLHCFCGSPNCFGILPSECT